MVADWDYRSPQNAKVIAYHPEEFVCEHVLINNALNHIILLHIIQCSLIPRLPSSFNIEVSTNAKLVSPLFT